MTVLHRRAICCSRILASSFASRLAAIAMFAVAISALPCCAQLPSDVRTNHWAAPAVEQAIREGIVPLQPDHQFHGEAHVTHVDAVVAVAALAKRLETNTWKLQPAHPVPDKVAKTIDQGAWKTRDLTRFELASALVRLGNYFAGAVSHPTKSAKHLGESVLLPQGVKPGIGPGHPAYQAVAYLTAGRMIAGNSPFLKPDTSFVKSAELSDLLASMAIGVNDKITELGEEEGGGTPDKSFQTKKSATPLRKP